jgi:hypothetical protein
MRRRALTKTAQGGTARAGRKTHHGANRRADHTDRNAAGYRRARDPRGAVDRSAPAAVDDYPMQACHRNWSPAPYVALMNVRTEPGTRVRSVARRAPGPVAIVLQRRAPHLALLAVATSMAVAALAPRPRLLAAASPHTTDTVGETRGAGLPCTGNRAFFRVGSRWIVARICARRSTQLVFALPTFFAVPSLQPSAVGPSLGSSFTLLLRDSSTLAGRSYRPLQAVARWRTFRWCKGQKDYSATTGLLFAARLYLRIPFELARSVLAKFDPADYSFRHVNWNGALFPRSSGVDKTSSARTVTPSGDVICPVAKVFILSTWST